MRKTAPAEKDFDPFDGKPLTVPTRVRRTTLDGREIPAEPQEETMKVKLNIDYTVCRDGIHPESFKAKETVELPAHIATVLVKDKRAVPVAEGKMEGGAPANKMDPGAPENKGAKGQGK
ncbi:MAG: hypothetical protein ABFD52_08855 [Acidobacteriota bacterium]